MPITVLLCTDGSDLAHAAILRGLAVVASPARLVLATVVDATDPTLLVGTGMAGGVMSADAFERHDDDRHAAAQGRLDAARDALGLGDAETVVLTGPPGPAVCALAARLPASVVVMGTRGRGGLRRTVLGSVSDHVVRNAPCPVVTTGPE
jgi:nucleotide-binding universal stress UspA family protein